MNFIAIYCIVNIKRAVHFFSRHTTQKCWLTCSRFGSPQYYSAYPPHNISKHFKRYICTQFLRTFTLHGTRVVISVPLSTKKIINGQPRLYIRAFNHGSRHYPQPVIQSWCQKVVGGHYHSTWAPKPPSLFC